MSSISQIISNAVAVSPLGASEADWKATWHAFCQYCGEQLVNLKGVTVPGFLILALVPQGQPIAGISRQLKPTFWFHSSWTATHHITPGDSHHPRPTGPLNPPVVNWIAISSIAGVSKHVVTSVMKELINAIGQHAKSSDVALDFGFARCKLTGGRYTSRFADQLLTISVRDARPLAVRAVSPGVGRTALGSSLGASGEAPPSFRPTAGAVGLPRISTSGGSGRPAAIAAQVAPLPGTYAGAFGGGYAAAQGVGMSHYDEQDADAEDADGEIEPSVVGGASLKGTPAHVERSKRKRILKRLHHRARQQEFYESWSGQVDAKHAQRQHEAASDRRNLEVMSRWAAEDEARTRERDALRRQQAGHVQTMNAQLAVSRTQHLRPRGEEMGDVFAGRAEPPRERPDGDYLKRQMEDKRQREAAQSLRHEALPTPYDPAMEREKIASTKREQAKELQMSYARQIAERKVRGQTLTQAGDEEMNYFFRNQTPELMKAAEGMERQRLREKARSLLERNARDLEEKQSVKRTQAEEDARRERSLYTATKTLDDERMVREEIERQRQKLAMLESWRSSKETKTVDKLKAKEAFKGWVDQLPFRNDSSDSDVDIEDLLSRSKPRAAASGTAVAGLKARRL